MYRVFLLFLFEQSCEMGVLYDEDDSELVPLITFKPKLEASWKGLGTHKLGEQPSWAEHAVKHPVQLDNRERECVKSVSDSVAISSFYQQTSPQGSSEFVEIEELEKNSHHFPYIHSIKTTGTTLKEDPIELNPRENISSSNGRYKREENGSTRNRMLEAITNLVTSFVSVLKLLKPSLNAPLNQMVGSSLPLAGEENRLISDEGNESKGSETNEDDGKMKRKVCQCEYCRTGRPDTMLLIVSRHTNTEEQRNYGGKTDCLSEHKDSISSGSVSVREESFRAPGVDTSMAEGFTLGRNVVPHVIKRRPKEESTGLPEVGTTTEQDVNCFITGERGVGLESSSEGSEGMCPGSSNEEESSGCNSETKSRELRIPVIWNGRQPQDNGDNLLSPSSSSCSSEIGDVDEQRQISDNSLLLLNDSETGQVDEPTQISDNLPLNISEKSQLDEMKQMWESNLLSLNNSEIGQADEMKQTSDCNLLPLNNSEAGQVDEMKQTSDDNLLSPGNSEADRIDETRQISENNLLLTGYRETGRINKTKQISDNNLLPSSNIETEKFDETKQTSGNKLVPSSNSETGQIVETKQILNNSLLPSTNSEISQVKKRQPSDSNLLSPRNSYNYQTVTDQIYTIVNTITRSDNLYYTTENSVANNIGLLTPLKINKCIHNNLQKPYKNPYDYLDRRNMFLSRNFQTIVPFNYLSGTVQAEDFSREKRSMNVNLYKNDWWKNVQNEHNNREKIQKLLIPRSDGSFDWRNIIGTTAQHDDIMFC